MLVSLWLYLQEAKVRTTRLRIDTTPNRGFPAVLEQVSGAMSRRKVMLVAGPQGERCRCITAEAGRSNVNVRRYVLIYPGAYIVLLRVPDRDVSIYRVRETIVTEEGGLPVAYANAEIFLQAETKGYTCPLIASSQTMFVPVLEAGIAMARDWPGRTRTYTIT